MLVQYRETCTTQFYVRTYVLERKFTNTDNMAIDCGCSRLTKAIRTRDVGWSASYVLEKENFRKYLLYSCYAPSTESLSKKQIGEIESLKLWTYHASRAILHCCAYTIYLQSVSMMCS